MARAHLELCQRHKSGHLVDIHSANEVRKVMEKSIQQCTPTRLQNTSAGLVNGVLRSAPCGARATSSSTRNTDTLRLSQIFHHGLKHTLRRRVLDGSFSDWVSWTCDEYASGKELPLWRCRVTPLPHVVFLCVREHA